MGCQQFVPPRNEPVHNCSKIARAEDTTTVFSPARETVLSQPPSPILWSAIAGPNLNSTDSFGSSEFGAHTQRAHNSAGDKGPNDEGTECQDDPQNSFGPPVLAPHAATALVSVALLPLDVQGLEVQQRKLTQHTDVLVQANGCTLMPERLQFAESKLPTYTQSVERAQTTECRESPEHQIPGARAGPHSVNSSMNTQVHTC